MPEIRIKRIYAPREEEDGVRILVDRLWPRGVKKEDAHIDSWLKGVAPSPDLRKWYHQDRERFPAFKERYRKELNQNPDAQMALQEIKVSLAKANVTLLYGAKDEEHNHARVLLEVILENGAGMGS